MALSSGKTKSRLDFSSAVNEGIFKETEPAPQKPAPKKETVKVNMPEPVEEKTETIVKEPAVTKTVRKETDMDKLRTQFAIPEKKRGVQKTVYLDDDVYQFINKFCMETNAKFSTMLNALARMGIDMSKNK